MPKLLSPAALTQYERDGFYFPVDVMSPEDAQALRARLEAFEAREGAPLAGNMRHKAHLLFTWLNELVHHPRILDAVEDVLGPDLLCWSTTFFIKEARNPAFVSWHQDSTYWGLSKPDVVTAWVALSSSNQANGAMEVIPGSHTMDQIPHRDTFDKNNLLTRGQEVAVDVDAARLLTWRVADLIDRGLPFATESSTAKLYASEAAVRSANAALQVFGGYGYIDEYPVGKYLRDARVTTVYEGTSQIQKLIIGRALTGVNAFV